MTISQYYDERELPYYKKDEIIEEFFIYNPQPRGVVNSSGVFICTETLCEVFDRWLIERGYVNDHN